MKCINRQSFAGFLVMIALLGNVAYAADASSDQESVAKFKQWLQDRDQQDQSGVQVQNTTVATAQSASAVVENSQENSGGDAVSDAAFDALVKQSMPMSPNQIMKYKGLVQKTQLASATFAGGAPKPVSSTLVVNMSPGSTPPAIRMYKGFITSLVFVDSTGASWAVESYDLGNAKAFNIQWDRKSNVLMIQPQESYTIANLAVKLAGLSTPVMLTLVPGQAFVDYRVDLRVNGFGPNAKQAMSSGMPDSADTSLIGVLDGVPPSGATTLTVSDGSASAWVAGDAMYVRTRFTILSPAWLNMMTSPDGMHAYKLQSTPSILMSEYGKPVEVMIKGE